MKKVLAAELRMVAAEKGLIECTSPRQEQRGTLAFVDPVVSTDQTLVQYTIHTSGYVRRKIEYLSLRSYRSNTPDNYQLNRTYRTPQGVERILATPLEQVAIFYKSINSYREYNGVHTV